MIHEMKLREVYFNLIKEGKKIYEIRLNDEKRQQIDVGDYIVFQNQSNTNERIKTEVQDLVYFDTFEEMSKTLPLAKVGFEKESLQEVINIYHQFYSEENEKKYGVLAIKVKTVN